MSTAASSIAVVVTPSSSLLYARKFGTQCTRIGAYKARIFNSNLKFISSRKNLCSASTNEAASVENSKPNEVEDEEEDDLELSESSAFLSDVANLVRLVDSRDVSELELKHKDFEILIKKHDSEPQPQAPLRFPGPHVLAHTAYPEYMMPPMAPMAAPASVPAGSSEPAPAAEAPPPAPAPVPAASGSPPMASPMSGTFYKSAAPGEPPFVKVGDTVKKGQVVCIIEAMKLMNEIEADRNGTILDILVGDGKSVGIGTPLFSIK